MYNTHTLTFYFIFIRRIRYPDTIMYICYNVSVVSPLSSSLSFPFFSYRVCGLWSYCISLFFFLFSMVCEVCFYQSRERTGFLVVAVVVLRRGGMLPRDLRVGVASAHWVRDTEALAAHVRMRALRMKPRVLRPLRHDAAVALPPRDIPSAGVGIARGIGLDLPCSANARADDDG